MRSDFVPILSLLRERRGFAASAYRPDMLQRRMEQRLARLGCPDGLAYLKILEADPAENDRLLNALTINVSGFFRDALAFEGLGQVILPRLVADKAATPGASLRIWSAGCACGEEPYSVAMLVADLLQRTEGKPAVSIFGTDIDGDALAQAQEGLYDTQSLEEARFGVVKRHFRPLGERFAVNPEIRAMVCFSAHDLFDPSHLFPVESIFGHFDLVLCRNVLIYIKPERQGEIFDRLTRALAPGGTLMLGRAEGLPPSHQGGFASAVPFANIHRKL